MKQTLGIIILATVSAVLPAYAANPVTKDYVDEQVRGLQTTDQRLQTQINAMGSGSGGSLRVGDYYQGGVIYWLDPTQSYTHGLIADIGEKGSLAWSLSDNVTGARLDGAYQGQNTGSFNTAQILASGAHSNFPAANACATSMSQGYTGWYLPSFAELNAMLDARMTIQQTSLAHAGGMPFVSGNYYWSSNESNLNRANSLLAGGGSDSPHKANTNNVRCIRAF